MSELDSLPSEIGQTLYVMHYSPYTIGENGISCGKLIGLKPINIFIIQLVVKVEWTTCPTFIDRRLTLLVDEAYTTFEEALTALKSRINRTIIQIPEIIADAQERLDIQNMILDKLPKIIQEVSLVEAGTPDPSIIRIYRKPEATKA